MPLSSRRLASCRRADAARARGYEKVILRGSTRKLPFPHARLAIDAVSSMLQPSTRGRVTLC
jgi:hypothetical protein